MRSLHLARKQGATTKPRRYLVSHPFRPATWTVDSGCAFQDRRRTNQSTCAELPRICDETARWVSPPERSSRDGPKIFWISLILRVRSWLSSVPKRSAGEWLPPLWQSGLTTARARVPDLQRPISKPIVWLPTGAEFTARRHRHERKAVMPTQSYLSSWACLDRPAPTLTGQQTPPHAGSARTGRTAGASRLATLLAALVATGAFPQALSAQDWNAAGGGDWNTASNWAFPVLVPNGPAESAEFGGSLPSAPSSTINLSAPISLGNILMNNPNAIAFTGSQITWNVPSPGYSILQSLGSVTLAAPSQLATNINLGGTGGTLEISGQISQQPSFQFGVSKSGPNTLTFSGGVSNTYSGPTVVNDGTLYLQKSPSVVAIPGDLTVNGGLAYWHSSEQVANSSTVTLNGGTLNFNSQAETIGRLNLYGGSIPSPSFGLGLGLAGTGDALVMRNTSLGIPVALSSAGGSNVVFDATNNGTAWISGALDLGSATRVFQVANGTAAVDMQLSGNITGAGGLTKSGPGTMLLNQGSFHNSYFNPFPPFNFVSNSGGAYATFGGTTTVTEGVLALDASHNLWTSYFGPPLVSGKQAVPGPLTITGGTLRR